MAMTGPGLASAVRSAINGISGTKTFTAVWDAVGTAIVSYISANAVVTVTVASVSGVTTGPGVSGSGTGTGTIS